MAFDFPSSPTVGQQYTPAGGPTYTYNGVGWVLPGGGGNVSNSGAGTLNDAIVGAGCPTVSTSVGKSDDRATWSFVPGENATAEQVLAGENVVATIPIETLGMVATGEFIARWSIAEYLALQKRRTTDNGKMAKDWDNVTSDPQINMNKKKTQTLKSNLVADGILTQARADAIFV